ncbi:hypothetical protein D3C77_528400 [compost metagenome]
MLALIRLRGGMQRIRIVYHLGIPLCANMPGHQISPCISSVFSSRSSRLYRYFQISVYGSHRFFDFLVERILDPRVIRILELNQLLFGRPNTLDKIQRIVPLIPVVLN